MKFILGSGAGSGNKLPHHRHSCVDFFPVPHSTMSLAQIEHRCGPRGSRCSAPPDLLNHIHNRRRDLCGGSFATTELLRRSRCCLLLVLVGWQVPWAVCREDRLQSVHNCSCWKIDSSLTVSTSAVTAIQTDPKTDALPQEERQPTIDNDSSRLTLSRTE